MRRTARISAAAALLTFLTLWFHGFWVFGVEMDFINGGQLPYAPGLRATPLSFAELAVLPAAFTALTLCAALSLSRLNPPLQRTLAIGLWIITWLYGADRVAFAFAPAFGTTWRMFAPFADLMAHRVLTPVSLVAGIVVLAALTRKS